MSTLQPEIIHFSSYNALEMEKILAERARAGLKFVPKRVIGLRSTHLRSTMPGMNTDSNRMDLLANRFSNNE